ncbi:MAG: RimK-like protein [Bacteroidetes bacterium]|nr:RimK-like protein [Bacteroidota bacterium]
MNPKILILSSIYDFSTDLVVLRLKEMQIPVLRLNREYLKDYKISLNPLQPSLFVKGPDFFAELTNEITSIFYRQPVFLRNTPSVPLSTSEQLERSQWMAFLRSLSVFVQSSWMNFPRSTYLAECKPYQLFLAKRIGFKVPSTLVSNDCKTIKDHFTDKIIIKSLDTVLLREGNDCLFTYSSLDNLESLSEENVSSTPLLAQTYLEDKIDLRVTIVGNQLYAVKILSNNKGIDGDWRVLPKNEIQYFDYCLEPQLEEFCKRLMRELDLNFGAIDLIETKSGIYFIEINPTGEWGWITDSNRQIDLSIARWLSNPRECSDRDLL